MSKKTYKEYAEKKARKSNLTADCVAAFVTGGLICCLGQLFRDFYILEGIDEKTAGTLSSCTLILLTAILTSAGIFDKIAKIGGGGTLVPITGFANAVASPGIDNKAEGLILGLGAKVFIIAGPVILYGILSAAIYGVVYYIMGIV